MLESSGGTIHRLLLDRVLGLGTDVFLQSSTGPAYHQVKFRCGCAAIENGRLDYFHLVPCEKHRHAFAGAIGE